MARRTSSLRAGRSDHLGLTSGSFPDLFLPSSEMPADLRAHARYPETFFRIQAEIYRTYHMRDPQAFYNKEESGTSRAHVATGERRRAGGADLCGGEPARRGRSRSSC